jgi:hypothetical protein
MESTKNVATEMKPVVRLKKLSSSVCYVCSKSCLSASALERAVARKI